MKLRIILLTLVIISTLSSARAQTEAPYTVKVGEFTQIRIRHGIPVDYICSNDSSGIITFTGSKELTEALTFDLSTKGKLTISLEPRTFNGKVGRVTVRSHQLVSIENEGDSAARILGSNSCPVFKAKQIGNGSISIRNIEANQVEIASKLGHGTITVSGKCDLAKINCTGTGTISAGSLMANEVKCTILGTGTVDCNVSSSLSIIGTGSGHLYYAGNPTEIKNRSTGIKIEAIDPQ